MDDLNLVLIVVTSTIGVLVEIALIICIFRKHNNE